MKIHAKQHVFFNFNSIAYTSFFIVLLGIEATKHIQYITLLVFDLLLDKDIQKL